MKNPRALWWLNVIVGSILTVGVGLAGLFLWGLWAGMFPQLPSAEDPDELLGPAVIFCVSALALGAVTVRMILKRRSLGTLRTDQVMWVWGQFGGGEDANKAAKPWADKAERGELTHQDIAWLQSLNPHRSFPRPQGPPPQITPGPPRP